MNVVFLTGRLTRDVETRDTSKGGKMYTFTVACNGRGQNAKASFFDCSAFGTAGEFIRDHFRKGDGIEVTGEIEIREYTDRDGKTQRTPRVTVDRADFPKAKKQAEPEAPADAPEDAPDPYAEDLPF